MRIVYMRMLVFKGFMSVLVAVVLGKVQVHPNCHQNAGSGEVPTDFRVKKRK